MRKSPIPSFYKTVYDPEMYEVLVEWNFESHTYDVMYYNHVNLVRKHFILATANDEMVRLCKLNGNHVFPKTDENGIAGIGRDLCAKSRQIPSNPGIS